MPIAKTIGSPAWIDSGSELTDGLDLLGLRLPVQTIGLSLLDGVTTVTPSIRYIAFRAWLIHKYSESRLPDSLQRFTECASYVECALVLANVSKKRSMNGLVGSDEAIVRLDTQTPNISLATLVKTPATTIYAGPSEQIGISWSRDEKLPGLTAERGKPLALCVDQQFSKFPWLGKLFAATSPAQVTREEVQELGDAARIDTIPDAERQVLIGAVLPAAPLPQERPRLGTYAALLALAKEKRITPRETDLFQAACSLKRFGEAALDRAADGWLTYCVRDAIAVSQEAVLAAILNEMRLGPHQGQMGIDSSSIIGELLARVDEHDAPLRSLQVLGPAESYTDLSLRELYVRVKDALTPGLRQDRGLSRWSSPINEPAIYNLALGSGAGALSMAVVAWLVVTIRVESGVRENLPEFGNLSYQGWRRLGLREVILPERDRLLGEDQPLASVAAEFAYRAVQQHLQIAWSRLQGDLRRDVALITSEGNRWYARGKGFSGGRTASRLREALGWMTQLRLIDANGITSEGQQVLDRTLRVLSDEGTS